MKWFRLWVDILDDHKINQLTDYEFRAFIFLLACASEEDAINGRLTRTLPAINRRCRRRQDHFNKAVETFQKLDLASVDDQGFITITKWNKRQFQSDKAYDRVKKHREQASVRNVSVTVNETPPDTDTDTDKPPISPKNVQPKKKKEPKKKPTSLPEGFSISCRVREWAAGKNHRNLDEHLENFISSCSAKGYEYLDWDAAFMNAIRQNWAKIGGNGNGPGYRSSERASFASKGRSEIQQGGLGIPPEYKPEARPDVSEATVKSNLARIKELTGG